MHLQKEFYSKLKDDKIKMNWNKNPIKMNEFLSFLTIEVERSRDHLGSCNGWTKLFNKEYKFEISGGIVNGVEYLDSLQFGIKLSNQYNNYVNPFYLFEILNNKGKEFFFNYYKEDIEKIKTDISNKIKNLEKELKETKELRKDIFKEVLRISSFENEM